MKLRRSRSLRVHFDSPNLVRGHPVIDILGSHETQLVTIDEDRWCTPSESATHLKLFARPVVAKSRKPLTSMR